MATKRSSFLLIQPREAAALGRLVNLPMTGALPPGASIDSVDSVIQEKITGKDTAGETRDPTTELTLGPAAFDNAAEFGPTVQFRVSGAALAGGQWYLLTVVVTTDGGETAEEEGYLLVKDLP